VCVFVCVSVCARVWTCACTCAFAGVRVCARARACVHACVHTVLGGGASHATDALLPTDSAVAGSSVRLVGGEVDRP
jgi:hypothetical protein